MRIYVTSIIEQGTHEQLLQAGSHYAELYNAYFRHPSLDHIQTAPHSHLAEVRG